MEIECASGCVIDQTTEEDVRKVFADYRERGEFVILSRSELCFLQAAGMYEGPFLIQYREGDSRYLFEGRRKLTGIEAEGLFLKYLKNDPTWKKDLEWKVIEKKPWWKF